MHIKIIHETTAALLLSSSPCHALQASSYYCLVNIQAAKFFSKIVDTTSKKSLMRENQKPILVNFHLLFLEYFIVKNHSKKSELTRPLVVKKLIKTPARALDRLTQYLWSFESRYQFAISATQL